MAFFQLVLKARKLEKARQSYEDEKLTSIDISKGAKHRYTFRQRIRRKKLWLKKKVKNLCNKVLALPKRTWCYKKYVTITTDGTLDNYIVKSFIGFVGGIFLTYLFFIFFVFQLHFKLSSATFICTIIGAILTLGLAFSLRIRCIVLLLLPQFFSKRGRQALMAYAFIIALTGPIKNILHNTSVLAESLACAQEQLKEAVKTIIDLAKQPFYALRDAISKIIKSVMVVIKKLKQTLIAIKRLVLSILRVITSVFQWLGSVINMCNKKLGTPFDRCQNVFEGAVADCKAKLGPIFGTVCNIAYVVSALCYIVKPLDFICMLVSFISDTVVGTVRNKIKRFVVHMKAMFYVKVKFSHSFQFETNQSKTLGEVSTGIAKEIRARTNKLFGFFDWMSFLTSFFAFFILLRVLRYRYKWLTSERFDNRYITNDVRTIDLIRARQDKETVLPLNSREKNRYVSLSSLTLIKSEKIKLARSVVFLGLATMKLLSYMSIDYCLYWVLYMIHLHGQFQSEIKQPNYVTIHVSGDGYLADLYRSIVKAFTPQGKDSEIDTMLCLPDPLPPNFDKYTQIIFLIFLCWFVTFFEPYGLRLRHVVLCQYYPDRAKQRAAWLYNHIIRSRGSFLKFARRQLRRKFGLNGEQIEKVTFKEKLWAICPCLNVLFPMKQNMCLLCGAVERPDSDPHIKCPTPGCVGLFCTQCFADLQNLCTICRSPIEYGDLTDMSEEKDSSEDQFDVPKKGIPKPEMDKDESDVEKDKDDKLEKPEEPAEEKDEETKPLLEETETEKPDETKEKDVAEQTEGKYAEDSDESSESAYSYTYQDASPEELDETEKRREPFKDVEAQKIKDDVTIQIFNEPLVRESSSCSESPTSCFVVRARRMVRAKLKKPQAKSSRREKDSDSSISIANTESWSTDEVDDEEVIHIEVGSDSEELLPKDRKDKAKLGRINRIVNAVARIPWLGKGEDDNRECKRLHTRRPSLMNRIISMLQTRESIPIQSYRRIKNIKDSSSSSSCSCDDENEALLKLHDKRETHLTRRRKSTKTMTENAHDDAEHLEWVPCDRKFRTKELPRHLKSTVRDTRFFQEDEIEESRSRVRARHSKDNDKFSYVRASAAATKEDKVVIFLRMKTELTLETSEDKETRVPKMKSVSEQADSTSQLTTESEVVSETTSKSETSYSKEPVDHSQRIQEKHKHVMDTFTETEESKDFEKPEGGDKTETEKEKVEDMVAAKEADVAELSVAKDTNKDATVPKEDKEKAKVQEKAMIVQQDVYVPHLYDPLAGLELYGAIPKRKSRKYQIADPDEIMPKDESKPLEEIKQEPAEEKLVLSEEKPAISESKTDLSKEKLALKEESTKLAKEEPPKQEEQTGIAEPKSDTKKTKVDKGTDLPDKSRSTQTKFYKRDSESKHPQRHISDQEKLRRLPKKSMKDSKNIAKSCEKRKRRQREKTVCHKKHHRSKKKKCSCSDKSILTDEDKYNTSDHSSGSKRSTKCTETLEWEPCETVYSSSVCHCRSHNYDSDICKCSVFESPREITSNVPTKTVREKFEMPVIKRYLPMYQNPELIDELKRHDRMKYIQEEEKKRRKFTCSFSSPDSTSVCSKQRNRRIKHNIMQEPPIYACKDNEKLPYQDSQAYKNVLRELETRVRNRKGCVRKDNSVPLIRLSKKADKSKNVEQLYPRYGDGEPRSVVKRMSQNIKVPFKYTKCKEHECDKYRETAKYGQMKRQYGDAQACECIEKTYEYDTLTSTDYGTDNE